MQDGFLVREVANETPAAFNRAAGDSEPAILSAVDCERSSGECWWVSAEY